MNILKILTDKRIKGNIGEDAVCKYLKGKRYKILARNYVADGHEIDIIAESSEHLCFIEVKTRSEDAANPYGMRPADSVDRGKRRSIISAATVYSSAYYGSKKLRFDVAEVFLDGGKRVKSINYMESAFTADYERSGYRR